RIRDFYETYYRPDRATLVVVGDVDVSDMEARIKARFADWAAKGPDRADPKISVPLSRGLEVKSFAETGAPSSITLTWLQPLDKMPPDRAQMKALRGSSLALILLNRRLQQLALSPERPFIGARAARGEAPRAAQMISVTASFQPGQWQKALAALERVRL